MDGDFNFKEILENQKEREREKYLYWQSPKGKIHYEQILFRTWLGGKGMREEDVAEDMREDLFQQFLYDLNQPSEIN